MKKQTSNGTTFKKNILIGTKYIFSGVKKTVSSMATVEILYNLWNKIKSNKQHNLKLKTRK